MSPNELPFDSETVHNLWLEAIRQIEAAYPEDVFPPTTGDPNESTDRYAAAGARLACRGIRERFEKLLDEWTIINEDYKEMAEYPQYDSGGHS